MMGKQHVKVGACVVAVGSAAGLVPWSSPGVAVMCTTLILAGSDWPDIDHKPSTVSQSWSYATGVVCLVTRFVSRRVYLFTRTRDDPESRDPHRTFTHTWPGAIIAGGLITLGLVSGLWGSIALTAALAGSAMRCLSRDLQYWGAAAGAVLGFGMWPEAHHAWWIWWLAFTIGCLTHVYSDCVTKEGAPLSWPFVVHTKEVPRVEGEGPLARRRRNPKTWTRRWHMVGPPQWMRFYTGSQTEIWVVRGVIVFTLLACYLLLVR